MCHNIYNIIYLPHKKCEIDHGHCNVTKTTTIWLEVSYLVIILTIVRLIIFYLK